METTARRALSELIDTLIAPEAEPAAVPQQSEPAVSTAPVDDLVALGVAAPAGQRPLPRQLPAQPTAVAAAAVALTVLPGAAKRRR